MLTYYEFLEVSPDATQQEIDKSYNQLKTKWHPDLNLHILEEATDRYKNINYAYQVLKDPRKRKLYDLQLKIEDVKAIVDDKVRNNIRLDCFSRIDHLLEKAERITRYNIQKFLQDYLAEPLKDYRDAFFKKEFEKLTAREIAEIEFDLLAVINMGLSQAKDKYLKCFLYEVEFEVLQTKYAEPQNKEIAVRLFQDLLKTHPDKQYAKQMLQLFENLAAIVVIDKAHIQIKTQLQQMIFKFCFAHGQATPAIKELKNLQETLFACIKGKEYKLSQKDLPKHEKEIDATWGRSSFFRKSKASEILRMFGVIDLLDSQIKEKEEQRVKLYDPANWVVVPYRKFTF